MLMVAVPTATVAVRVPAPSTVRPAGAIWMTATPLASVSTRPEAGVMTATAALVAKVTSLFATGWLAASRTVRRALTPPRATEVVCWSEESRSTSSALGAGAGVGVGVGAVGSGLGEFGPAVTGSVGLPNAPPPPPQELSAKTASVAVKTSLINIYLSLKTNRAHHGHDQQRAWFSAASACERRSKA
ncbi:hypothetical protein VARIO8X_120572 [Burkholderiales bacterium 8X]|nr:hypothetical protein VARIO8X_120572 [Burkholderiales bacterium 8X]